MEIETENQMIAADYVACAICSNTCQTRLHSPELQNVTSSILQSGNYTIHQPRLQIQLHGSVMHRAVHHNSTPSHHTRVCRGTAATTCSAIALATMSAASCN
jgi:hypothetical protein